MILNNTTKYWDIKARVLNDSIIMEYKNNVTGSVDTKIKKFQEVMLENIPSYKEPTK